MSTETRGKLFLVGFGPGGHEHLTFRARQAIAESEVVIGYSTYIKLIADLLDGKQVIRKGMTEELDRATEAIELARAGRTVALVSSGDIGIYGMAGPTFECLRECGWRPGDNPDVEVVPGVTALSACASLLGAPLMHDFAAISLSDLLTPWPVIERRIAAAAAGDFVIALYNPQSKRRTWQLSKTQEILLRYRTPQTPVGIVKSAYRKLQHIVVTDLAHMVDYDIGMLTTILIGNSHTEEFAGLIVTPRGYANKYDLTTHEALPGQTPGLSLRVGEALPGEAE
ncbi:MAG: precorrin-3B C(17)-methyltransferase [Candidatus Binatia bacterium]|nr:precorrin-3B C(17)-methyltransferase [Candidatus Binatia bacterium]